MTVTWIAVLWLAFAATHMGMSSLRWRPGLVSALGERGFQGVYSLVSLAIFVPLVWIYTSGKHAGPFFWYLGPLTPVRWLAYVLMGAALTLVVAGATRPSPASVAPGPARVVGVFRITRHPVFMGLALFGLAHLLTARVHAAEFVFFGGFVVFSLVGCSHQDQRKLVTAGEDFRRFHAETPFLPFTGRDTLRGLKEMPIPLVVGVGLAVLVRYYHATLFGGAWFGGS
jgi:uncharacterized membrane protein